jgi:hypothetical protein
VLERRPDVASAERAMAAANAQIGVATAAYYPSITITPNLGYESRMLANLFSAPSALWAIGAQFTQPLFSGGRLDANVDIARANYDATVANYRRVVLTAMQEVEDGITGLAALERADRQARTAVDTARKVLELATARYEGGATTYLDVITAQQSLLAAERLAAQLGGQRLLTSVFLIKALGGDWAGPGLNARRRAPRGGQALPASGPLPDSRHGHASPRTLQTRLETVIALSRLLERVEARGLSIGADQYRALVRQIQAALATPLPGPALEAILGAHPATAEVYENMHYDVSGLSRSPLERSVATELLGDSGDRPGRALVARPAERATGCGRVRRGLLGGDRLGDELAKAHHRGVHRQRQHRRRRGRRRSPGSAP